MAETKLTFEVIWIKSDADCSICYQCEEPIYGKKYTLNLAIGDKKTETKVRLCESCYGMICHIDG